MNWDTRNEGSQIYSQKDYDLVVTYIKRHFTGPDNIFRQSDLEVSELSHIPARGRRAIISAADGKDFVLAEIGRQGSFVCQTAEQAEGFSRKMRKQVKTMGLRGDRRDDFVKTLPSAVEFAQTPPMAVHTQTYETPFGQFYA